MQVVELRRFHNATFLHQMNHKLQKYVHVLPNSLKLCGHIINFMPECLSIKFVEIAIWHSIGRKRYHQFGLLF